MDTIPKDDGWRGGLNRAWFGFLEESVAGTLEYSVEGNVGTRGRAC